MRKNVLLGKLPAFTNDTKLIEKNQGVRDIIKEVLQAHAIFAPDYDRIASEFDYPTVLETCRALFDFCKNNIRYRVETESKQTTKSPAAILALGDSIGGDCKHYAGFIAGVLDALCRLGRPINWHYRFASYSLFDSSPGHVFVVVNDHGKEIWIDPVLSTFNERSIMPYHKPIDKRPKLTNMALYRVSGMDTYQDVANLPGQIAVPTMEDTGVNDDPSLTPEVEDAIKVLLYYGVMNTEGSINDTLLQSLAKSVDSNEFAKISSARLTIQDAVNAGAGVGSIFDTIWRGIKKVTLAVPRNAYLSLVALNVFGLATKLHHAIYNADGQTYWQPGQNQLYEKWNSLGGDWNNIRNAIDSGFKKIAILGAAVRDPQAIGAAAAIPVWVATASAIIAAITPLVNAILKSKSQAGALDPSINPATGLPYGLASPNPPGGGSGGFDIIEWAKENPIAALGGAFLIYKFVTHRKGL